jgi:FAD:protein FMN transferase
LGTFVEIEVAGAEQPRTHAAIAAAFEAVARVHELMSFHEQKSDVSVLNEEAAEGPIAVHPWTFEVLQLAVDLHRRSNGIFDISVAPILQDIGVLPRMDRAASLQAGSDAIQLLPGRRVYFTSSQTRIDLGGIAKGFAVDRAIDALRTHGMPAGLVNAGGDLAVFGQQPFPIHIRDPRNPGQLMCKIALQNGALASSGSRPRLATSSSEPINSAIIDPRARSTVREPCGVTVRAPTCAIADALTKIVMILGSAAIDLLGHYQADALFVPARGNVQVTPGFERRLCRAA